MPATPPATHADYLLDMASDLDRYGLWDGHPNFLDPATGRLDVPAAAFRATTGTLPFIFALPTLDGAEAARSYIENTPAAMALLQVIADHLTTVYPHAEWQDDVIDRLASWPHLLGVDLADIPQILRDLAHTLTVTATAPAAA
ncbi:hypothetical protein ACFVY4_26910 [Streptomyces sp. NPDC058299]|uniref:hypothetical protein n=1 Tax=Streptomyces sp. NPDC058299 TaxID=3346435 RepID=UPI0036ECF41F